MADKSILILTTFVAICSGLIGYGVHDVASKQSEIEWEVLLTGVAAIAGGWLAYRGATEPNRYERRQVTLTYLFDVKDVTAPLQNLVSPKPFIVRWLGKMSDKELTENYGDTLEAIIEHLEPPPQLIVDPELKEKFEGIRSQLIFMTSVPFATFNFSELKEVSEKVVSYIDVLEKRMV